MVFVYLARVPTLLKEERQCRPYKRSKRQDTKRTRRYSYGKSSHTACTGDQTPLLNLCCIKNSPAKSLGVLVSHPPPRNSRKSACTVLGCWMLDLDYGSSSGRDAGQES